MKHPAIPGQAHGERLLYVMGASGSGKDTLLRSVRETLRPNERILIAHRYITRPSSADEASLALTPQEFERRAGMGCFALHWHSHGLSYGIGIELDTWLEAGNTVLINGSRAHLAQACERYPALCAVQVTVALDVLEKRLAQRGRETPDAIAGRLARARESFATPPGCALVQLDNSGPAQQAADMLLALARDRSGAGISP